MSTKTKSADPRFLRTLDALIEAVTALLDTHPVQEISITRIVERAGVTRPTFYQHFADVPAAVQRAALVRLAAAFPVPGTPAGDRLDLAEKRLDVERHAGPVLAHLQTHRAFYRRVLDEAANADFFEELITFVTGRLLRGAFDDAPRPGGHGDRATVVAGGMTWLVIRWLRDDGAMDKPEEMARRLAEVAVTLMPDGG